jgi:hypothetical protein
MQIIRVMAIDLVLYPLQEQQDGGKPMTVADM